jgi:hypothetical protein
VSAADSPAPEAVKWAPDRPVVTPQAMDGLASSEAQGRFRKEGYLCIERGLDPAFCRQAIASLQQASMIEVESRDLRGTTRFLTLNGDELLARVPGLAEFYVSFASVVSRIAGEPMTPIDNRRVGISLNYTPPGGGFVRHFDRNQMTVSLYLNTVEAGELTVWPNIVSPLVDLFGRYKLPIALRLTRLKRPIDIPPREGTVVVFSRRTVHAVSPVVGQRARVSIIMAYDRPQASFMDVPDYYGRGNQRVILDPVQA